MLTLLMLALFAQTQTPLTATSTGVLVKMGDDYYFPIDGKSYPIVPTEKAGDAGHFFEKLRELAGKVVVVEHRTKTSFISGKWYLPVNSIRAK